MSGSGRRHYNIWIAYSDLFSNLATFLFISAVGIFAALGSGAVGIPGPRQPQCRLAPPVAASLARPGSALREVDVRLAQEEGGRGCGAYYMPGEYRFQSGTLNFVLPTGAHATAADFREKICTPVWAALANGQFKGRISFIAVAAVKEVREYPRTCGGPLPAASPLSGFPAHRKAADVIRECVVTTGDPYHVCRHVRDCMNEAFDERGPACQGIWAAYMAASQSDAACRRQVAQTQAKLLYDQCAAAIGPYEDGLFHRKGTKESARRDDGRQMLWQGVDFEARLAEAFSGRDAPSLTPGTVLVQISSTR